VLLWVKPRSQQKWHNLTRLSLRRMQRAVPNRRKDCVRAQSTQFYTKLIEPVESGGGPEAVGAWAAKQDVDVFGKKLVFVPINYTDAHWSLCVVVNPGAIDNPSINEGSPLPCILFFDSFGGTDTGVFAQVRMWLNSEWRRLEKEKDATHKGDRFTEATFPGLKPVGEYASFDHAASFLIPSASSHIIYFLSELPPKERIRLWSFSLSVCLWHVSAPRSRIHSRRSGT
jgi:hypothetical protein